MAKGHLSLSIRKKIQVAYPFKISIQITLFDPVPIMVADDQMLFSTQLSEILFRRLFISKHQIAQYDHRIMGVNTLVPITDQNVVHFFDIGKWPIAQANNILMAQMQVTCKVYHSESRAFRKAS